jgi:hypothetical protein
LLYAESTLIKINNIDPKWSKHLNSCYWSVSLPMVKWFFDWSRRTWFYHGTIRFVDAIHWTLAECCFLILSHQGHKYKFYFSTNFGTLQFRVLASWNYFCYWYVGFNAFWLDQISISNNNGLNLQTALSYSYIAVVYTIIGGLKAVIYTDTIQWLILIFGLVFIITTMLWEDMTPKPTLDPKYLS